jgi:hypothetical protein
MKHQGKSQAEHMAQADSECYRIGVVLVVE